MRRKEAVKAQGHAIMRGQLRSSPDLAQFIAEANEQAPLTGVQWDGAGIHYGSAPAGAVAYNAATLATSVGTR